MWNFLKSFSTFSTLTILDYAIIGRHNFLVKAGSDIALIQTSPLFSFKCNLISIRTTWFTQQKQWGLYRNKVTCSLLAIQRPGHWTDICRMVYYVVNIMGLFPWRKLYILINLVHFHNFGHKYASFCSFLHTVEDSFIIMFAVKVVKTMMKVPPWKQNNLTCLTWLVSIPAVYAYVLFIFLYDLLIVVCDVIYQI